MKLKLLFAFILPFCLVYSELKSDPQWDDFFANYQTDQIVLPLDHETAFHIPLHRNFKYAFSSSKNSNVLWEFTLKDEDVDDWSELITIEIMEAIREDHYRSFAESWLRSIAPTNLLYAYSEEDSIQSYKAFFYSPAIAYPYGNLLSGLVEITGIKGIQGPEGMYLVQYSIRTQPQHISENANAIEAYLDCIEIIPARLE